MSAQFPEGENGAREESIASGGDEDGPDTIYTRNESDHLPEDTIELEDEAALSPSGDVQPEGSQPDWQAVTTPPRRLLNGSPSLDGSASIPDDTPSLQDSGLSSPHSEALPYRSPSLSRSPSGAHRPFDRRFQSRLSSSPLSSPRATSPAFLANHSRHSSIASFAFPGAGAPAELDTGSAPWDVIRWTRLRKITGQAFSEIGKRNFGRPTCVVISTNIIIGTSKGMALVFDYQQVHKAIIGPGTQAVECGPITSLAVSADHSTIACGHENGHIFTWEIARVGRPFLHIPPVVNNEPHTRTADGHIPGASVLHLGFLGTRRTALVSADERGMAFSHLASRGLGAVVRAVKTTRILGRYPDLVKRGSKPRKPSSVLAFSPLPLGNVEQASDSVGLVAMMTPYLLVIVSTTPIAQTQHKVARPKELREHGTMSAALSWFPAIRLKGTDSDASKNKLVYCWSNILSILEVDEVNPSEPASKEQPPEFRFETKARCTSDEAIVAVQWLSRSVLAVLTITQQLLILEDKSMRVTDSFDLLQKHIYHSDLFSQQLHAAIEQLDEEDASMHGVVADAFFMSFRAYKGRLFLLGFNDILVGNLSNWADRLLALMESGDFIAAIRLATSYYLGAGEKLTIGLPEDDKARYELVRPKLMEMMSASLRYAFGRNQQASPERLEKPQLAELAEVCISSCISVNDREFLFDEVYTWYDDNNMAAPFLDAIEPYIVSGEMRAFPPPAIKTLVEHFLTNHTVSDLENIICLLETSSMDIDQVTTLCRKHNLYEAYIHVWTRTLEDFTGPLEELLSMSRRTQPNGHTNEADRERATAFKCFPYLSYILTGRQYPRGEDMPDDLAIKAKAQIYTFLFSGRSDADAPKYSSRSSSHTAANIFPFPHLRVILSLNAANFMSVLNEAFEDSFLNDASEQMSNGSTMPSRAQSPVYNQAINRQFIVSILLEVMTPPEFDPIETVYLDMFLARNLPKYPQYILLSGTTLHQILLRLCHSPSDDLAEECQLSVEYLLSVYHPPDIQTLISAFEDARFYRVLKTVYRNESQYSHLIEMYFKDPEDEEEVFETLVSLLSPRSSLTDKQRQRVEATVRQHASDLLGIDVSQTSVTISRLLPHLHDHFLSALEEPRSQFQYLRALLEPSDTTAIAGTKVNHYLIECYVHLMCQYNPKHVSEYVDNIQASDLHLERILPALESSGIIDAAVMLLARQGQVKDAMDRLKRHLETLEAALAGIMQHAEASPDAQSTDEAVQDLLNSLDKYVKVGIWLCQRQTSAMPKTKTPSRNSRRPGADAQTLSFEETLWLGLVNSVVKAARNILPTTEECTRKKDHAPFQGYINAATGLRSNVQQVFTALLAATTAAREGSTDRSDLSFLRILRAFLTDAAASSPSLSQLRTVIRSIFSAYAYEESLLYLANEMLNKDLFVHVDDVTKLRQQGWRPRSQTCEICRRRVWGPGAGAAIWDAWQQQQATSIQQRREKANEDTSGRGKGKAVETHTDESVDNATAIPEGSGVGSVIIFACRHLYHQQCLQQKREKSENPLSHGHDGDYPEMACPVCT